MDGILSKTEIYAGESVGVTASVPEGTASASLRFTGGQTFPLDVSGTSATGTISPAVTLALPRNCRYYLYVTDGAGFVSCTFSGTMTVAKLTSDYRAALAAVDAAIAAYGSNPNKSITVGEISISYRSLDDLLALRSHYAGLVAADEAADGETPVSGKFTTVLSSFFR